MTTQHSMTLDLFESIAEPQAPDARVATEAQSIEVRVGLTKAAPREMHPALRSGARRSGVLSV